MCCVANFLRSSADRFSCDGEACRGGLGGAGFGAGVGLLTDGCAGRAAGGGAVFLAGAFCGGAAFSAGGFFAAAFFECCPSVLFAPGFAVVVFLARTVCLPTFFFGAVFFFAATFLRAGARDAFLALFFLVAISSPGSVAPVATIAGLSCASSSERSTTNYGPGCPSFSQKLANTIVDRMKPRI